MRLNASMKLLGDAYPGGFSCGLSMTRSGTMEQMKVTEDTLCNLKDEKAGIKTMLHPSGVLLSTKVTPAPNGVKNAYLVETTVTNSGSKKEVLEMLSSFALEKIEADKIMRLQSFWSAEGKLRIETIEDLHLEPSWNRCGLRCEKFGVLGSMPVRRYFPFVAAQNSKTGQFVAVNLYCASSWQMEIICKEDETIDLVGGLCDRDFGQWKKTILPGEKFTAPRACFAVGNSLYEVCDRLVKAQSPKISPLDDHMGIMFNEYCTTWGNPSFDNVKKICDKIADKGIQYLVIDSGWYGKSDGWWNSIGDWDVNEERFPNGMKPIADYIRSKNMIPGLWYEMESVAPKSKYYEDVDHLVKKDGLPLTVGQRRFWDMEDPWVISYLSEKLIKLLKECGYGYLKIDYNDSMGVGCDDPDGLGEGLRKKIIASQKFFEKIREELPDLVIENCSSGGHRLEPSMMELASQASFSDAHETKAIPIIAANMHRVIKPEQSQIWAVLRAQDSDERLFYSLLATCFGRMCLSGDIYNLNDHQWQIVEEGMAFYRQAAPIIKDGITILQDVTTTSYNHPTKDQLVVRTLNDLSLVILHRFENSSTRDLSSYLQGKIIASFGNAHSDFSAQAWIVSNIK